MSGINTFKRATTPVFGPCKPTRLELMGIRFADAGGDGSGAGAGAGDGANNDGNGQQQQQQDGAAGKYTPPASQADLDRIVSERLARERARFSDYDQAKAAEAELKKLKEEGATEQEKAVAAAREQGKAEVLSLLTNERVSNALDRALDGRTLNTPSVLLNLDRQQFVKDGAVDAEAVKTWVAANSVEAAKPGSKDPSQGKRDATATGGTVQAGRDAYKPRNPQK